MKMLPTLFFLSPKRLNPQPFLSSYAFNLTLKLAQQSQKRVSNVMMNERESERFMC